MTNQPFTLTNDRSRLTPTAGEELGDLLANAANDLLTRRRATSADGTVNDYTLRQVAQLRHLAAQAFDAGASVTIGHNRADRYMAAAERLRSQAGKDIIVNGTGNF